MGRAEAQVACQFSVAVLTFATLLPNAIDRFCLFFCYIIEGYIKTDKKALLSKSERRKYESFTFDDVESL